MAPQTYIHGQLDDAERLVLQYLQFLPDESIVYAQPKLVYKREIRKPDFVIVYYEWGVVVLEVKDWVGVEDRNRREAYVRERGGNLEWRSSPVDQARGAAEVLCKMLEEDEDLRDYAGKRDFSYAYGGILPHLPLTTIRWLEAEWGETYLLGREDLRSDRITQKIAQIHVPFRNRLTERQVRAICAIIDPRNKNVDRATGEFKGVYDRTQESIFKEPRAVQVPAAQVPIQQHLVSDLVPSREARLELLRSELPEETAAITLAPHVRLVRGFAGTGKTDVLVLRARYLHEQYPDLDILVTTFNDPLYASRLLPELKDLAPKVEVTKVDTLCSNIYKKKHGVWNQPQDTGGLVVRMAEQYPLIQELGTDFISQEFIWMKETGRTERQSYVTGVREGRSDSGRRLTRRMKEQVFDLFEAYQARLSSMPAYDWVDLHERALVYLCEGVRPDKQYDYVLIDEAQHFAPSWLQILTRFLKPGGDLFMCDDPSQSVYRYYSWLQKGVDVRGRTRWLRIPYRNTYQIFEAAYVLISDNPIALRLLNEDSEPVRPDVDIGTMADGPRPQVHSFPSWAAEREFVTLEIANLIREGVHPTEIGVLHEEKYVLDGYRSIVPQGVQLYEVKRQTGLEYKAVFIPRFQDTFRRTVGVVWEEDDARQRLKLYMMMTRARRWLYLLYQNKWPKAAEPIRPYVDWVKH